MYQPKQIIEESDTPNCRSGIDSRIEEKEKIISELYNKLNYEEKEKLRLMADYYRLKCEFLEHKLSLAVREL